VRWVAAGCCFLFGGFYYEVQTFNESANRACNSLLFLSAIGIIIPTAAKSISVPPMSDSAILSISRGTAVILLFW
jgi:Ca2+:H+ antiporter